MGGNKKFTLITGGADHKIEVNRIAIEVVSDSVFPLPVDVRVFEEDTYLVLTVDPAMRYTDEHPIKLMTHIMEAKTKKPGSVVRKNSSWYAVVYDLDADPVCREEWIDNAYREALQLAEKRGITRLGLPLLGTVHGPYPAQDSMQLLINQIKSLAFSKIKKIVIVAEQGFEEDVRKILAAVHR
ncbi:MAG: hypothetical protein OEM01_03690 [Desulfobulbaceae bacterium]|nr:hypothetical protein [Desulfobulbaceae bacterium]